LADI